MKQPPTRQTIFSGRRPNWKARKWWGVGLTLVGLFIFILGVEPALFGLDRSPVIGFVQIAVFLFGLGLIALGGYVGLATLWKGRDLTMGADIGLRLLAPGYLIAVVSGMADVFGIGSEVFPRIPSFGIWQLRGVMVGELTIALGFLLLLPRKKQSTSSQDEEAENASPTPGF